MSFEFLSVGASPDAWTPVARSPMEPRARAAGARFEVREGWSIAAAYASADEEADACRQTAGWADSSHLGKLELQAPADALPAIAAQASGDVDLSLEFGTAARSGGAWWCRLTPTRALVVCDSGQSAELRERLAAAAATVQAAAASVTDVSTEFAALTLVGPQVREVFARFCAIDLRPVVTPVAGLRPGSVARQPGIVLREAEDRFLMLFGWALGEYMWTVVQDAARSLGGMPVGADALARLTAGEVASHA